MEFGVDDRHPAQRLTQGDARLPVFLRRVVHAVEMDPIGAYETFVARIKVQLVKGSGIAVEIPADNVRLPDMARNLREYAQNALDLVAILIAGRRQEAIIDDVAHPRHFSR